MLKKFYRVYLFIPFETEYPGWFDKYCYASTGRVRERRAKKLIHIDISVRVPV